MPDFFDKINWSVCAVYGSIAIQRRLSISGRVWPKIGIVPDDRVHQNQPVLACLNVSTAASIRLTINKLGNQRDDFVISA